MNDVQWLTGNSKKVPRERIELSTFRWLCSSDYETDALPTALSRQRYKVANLDWNNCSSQNHCKPKTGSDYAKTSSSAGFEPATSGLEVRRAIHCATKTTISSKFYLTFSASLMSVGGVKVSIVAFQAIDPGSIPGRRTSPF